MNITKVTTERISRGAHGLVAAANIEGEGLDARAISWVVKFGNVEAEGVMPLGIAPGVRAIFRQMPPAGAQLSIGYANQPLTRTSFEWIVPPGESVA